MKSDAPKKYSVYSEFDIQKHKETFIQYCEVIIDKDGKVRYATPSHQMMLVAMYCVKKGTLPAEYLLPQNTYKRIGHEVISAFARAAGEDYEYLDTNDFCLKELGAISVRYDFYDGEPNQIQKRMLKRFNVAGITKIEGL